MGIKSILLAVSAIVFVLITATGNAVATTFQIDGIVNEGDFLEGTLTGSVEFDNAAVGSSGTCGSPASGNIPCTVYSAQISLNVLLGIHTYTSDTTGEIGVVNGIADSYYISELDAAGTIPFIFPNGTSPRFSMRWSTLDNTLFTNTALPTTPEFQSTTGLGNGGLKYDVSTTVTGFVSFSQVRLSQPSAVPVPAAAWLFGSGLIGLVGVARRKKVSKA